MRLMIVCSELDSGTAGGSSRGGKMNRCDCEKGQPHEGKVRGPSDF
jgi:hypothetical protein